MRPATYVQGGAERAGVVVDDAVHPFPDATTVLELVRPVGLPTFTLGYYADLAESYDWVGEERGDSLVIKEPVGVVASITPWNLPLHEVAFTTAAALAAGCTVVAKPSELAPLAVRALADLFDEIGLPAGVFDLVSGYGPAVGEALVAHPDVAALSFTGSTRAGKRIGGWPPRRSSGSASSWAGSRPTSCSTTPTSRRP